MMRTFRPSPALRGEGVSACCVMKRVSCVPRLTDFTRRGLADDRWFDQTRSPGSIGPIGPLGHIRPSDCCAANAARDAQLDCIAPATYAYPLMPNSLLRGISCAPLYWRRSSQLVLSVL